MNTIKVFTIELSQCRHCPNFYVEKDDEGPWDRDTCRLNKVGTVYKNSIPDWCPLPNKSAT